MSESSGPTWYEILGVERTASADEIKAAWRDATDKFEPGAGSGQFRLFNEAADVLLNPEKRAAYDASLGDVPPVAAPTAEPEPAAPVVLDGPDLDEGIEGDIEPAPATAPASLADRLAANFRTVLLVCIPVLVVAAALAVVTRVGVNVGSLYLGADAEQVVATDDGKEAMAAAERALGSVLAYDYRHMDADRTRAVGFLTPAYAQKFSKTFSLLTTAANGEVGPAVKTKTVVTADVLGTAVSDAEKNRVRVVAFVNQNAVKNGGQPSIFQNRLVVTMVHRGDAWLIDDVKTY